MEHRLIAYDRQTYNSPNPVARLAHRARYGIADHLIQKYLEPSGAMLDFGCGDGRMLKRVRMFYPEAHLVGYEPLMKGVADGYERAVVEDDAWARPYNLVTAFEVLEHLEDDEICHFFDLVDKALRPDQRGTLIISVPNMLGPVLIPKIINVQYVRRADWKYSLSEALRAAFFLGAVPRHRGAGYLTHKGFDWRDLRVRLKNRFIIVEERLSPFPFLPWWLNSQWFAVCRRR